MDLLACSGCLDRVLKTLIQLSVKEDGSRNTEYRCSGFVFTHTFSVSSRACGQEGFEKSLDAFLLDF